MVSVIPYLNESITDDILADYSIKIPKDWEMAYSLKSTTGIHLNGANIPEVTWGLGSPQMKGKMAFHLDQEKAPAKIPRSDEIPQTALVSTQLRLHRDKLDVRIPMEMTFYPSINAWWIVGPFDNPEGIKLDRIFTPEQGAIDLKTQYQGKGETPIQWQLVTRENLGITLPSDECFVDFHKLFGHHYDKAAAYALTYLHSPAETEALLSVGADDGCAAWVNGKEVIRNPAGRPYTSKQDKAKIHLRKGSNTLLLKISQGDFAWGFCAYVETPDGRPMPGLKVDLNP
jgi:hypothetical protein